VNTSSASIVRALGSVLSLTCPRTTTARATRIWPASAISVGVPSGTVWRVTKVSPTRAFGTI
jgi:hypothetical protein